MLAAAANSTSTATSGSIFPSSTAAAVAAAVASRPRKRLSSRSHSMVAAEEQGVENGAAAPAAGKSASNVANGDDTCCSVGEGDAVSSPVRRASLRAPPKSGNKVARISHKQRPQDSSSRPPTEEAQQHLVGPLFTKQAFVVVMLAVIATSFWKWSNRAVPEGVSVAQVKELEDFSRKTTKWMQVQLELVDMKIGKEIQSLKRDVEEKLEEQTMSLGTSIMNLKAQVNDMDLSMRKLTEHGLLTRKEGLELIQSIIQQRAAEESGKSLGLDDVRIAARQIVEAELEKHSADGIGRVDYALGSGGGKVIEHSEGFFTGSRTSWLSILGAGLSAGGSVKHPMARKVLEPSYGEPGQCLPLKGDNVFVEIALRTHIHPDAITIDHVPKSVAYDVTSAPKDFRVFGWLERSIQADTIAHPVTKLLLGEFSYDLQGPHIQTFNFPEEMSRQLINTVRVHVTSNHGSPSHTCIYRIRVHGFEPSSQHF